jgi:hypothetical protein
VYAAPTHVDGARLFASAIGNLNKKTCQAAKGEVCLRRFLVSQEKL